MTYVKLLLWVVAWCCCCCTSCDATIVAGRETFDSLPIWMDSKDWNPPSHKWTVHLQTLESNPYLCGSTDEEESGAHRVQFHNTSDYVSPMDDRPVAILAERGKCNFCEKGWVGSVLDFWVKIVIIYDEPPHRGIRVCSTEAALAGMLFVSYETGMALKEMLEQQTPEERDLGGMLIALDGMPPSDPSGNGVLGDPAQWDATATWGFILFVMSLNCIVCIQAGMLPFRNGGGGRHSSDGHLLLTDEQAQELPDQLSDGTGNCAVCLEDFEEGETLKVLPCGHLFHGDCIVPWLTERHSTCPLCKVDVLECTESSDDKSTASSTASAPGWFRRVFFRRSWTRLDSNNLSEQSSLSQPTLPNNNAINVVTAMQDSVP